MAAFPYEWCDVPGMSHQISKPLQNARGEWMVATRFGDLQWSSFYAATAEKAVFLALEACAGVTRTNAGLLRPKAARPATEPTPAGLQYIMPGCEKDQTRGPAQMSLF